MAHDPAIMPAGLNMLKVPGPTRAMQLSDYVQPRLAKSVANDIV